MTTKPLIQIVDRNDNLSGVASIDEARAKGLIRRLARVIVEDQEGNVLLQKRSSKQKLFPNRWDTSAAGHVDAGEDYLQAAKREMSEEIGLKNVDMQEVDYFYNSFVWQDMKLNQFQRVYKVVVAHDTQFKVDKDEVVGTQWFSPHQLKQLFQSNPESFTDGAQYIIKRFYL